MFLLGIVIALFWQTGGNHKMRKVVIAVFVLAAAAACSRTESYESGGTVDTIVNNQDTTRGLDIDFGTKKDTINVPIIGTQTETLIVKKPVVQGRRPVEVKRPTVDVNRKP